MTKTVLLVGCGSKSGLELTKSFLSANYKVDLITGTLSNLPVRSCVIDWQSLNPANIELFLKGSNRYDAIVFNQNARVLEPTCYSVDKFKTLDLWKINKLWNQAYYNNCILPFHIIHTLGSKCDTNTRVVWMLSELIYNHIPGIGYADYIGHKYQNYVLMKNFSQNHTATFLGINRGKIPLNPVDLIDFLECSSTDINGKIFYSNGTEDTNFNFEADK
jgi:hypothetical protein